MLTDNSWASALILGRRTELDGSVYVYCPAEGLEYVASPSSSGQSPVVANSAVLDAALAAACKHRAWESAIKQGR